MLQIVIVSWNTRELLKTCLESVFADAESGPIEVWVVDNASTDGSQEMVRRAFPQVVLVENLANLGFAPANNLAIRRGEAEFVLLLNSDTQVLPGALGKMAAFMQAHPSAGAAGPRISNPDGSLQTSCYPMPTLGREFWRLFHLDRLRPYGSYRMDRWSTAGERKVDVLLGACLLLRRSALDEIGLLEESYFMYSEDLDICYRLARRGWEAYWLPQAEIVHFGGQSTRQAAGPMFLRLYRSKLEFFQRHHGRPAAFFYKMVLLSASLARLALSPLAWLLPSPDRSRRLELAHNYRRLVRELFAW